jgi:hypothetical protein
MRDGTLVHVERPGHSRGDRIGARLRGRGNAGMSTDEILALTRRP